MQGLGDRMKAHYENRQRFYLTRRTPVIIRLDGRAFHTVTKDMDKPFDEKFISAMRAATDDVLDALFGCKCAFVQSDEVSFLLTDYDNLHTKAWFDYNLCKIVSVAASEMTAAFAQHKPCIAPRATFDARAFNIPREEVANYFLWRAQDWHRNSLLMYAQSFFSHEQMLGKSAADLHEMLHEIGKNWTTDLASHIKNGSWCDDGVWFDDVLPEYESVSAKISRHIAAESE